MKLKSTVRFVMSRRLSCAAILLVVGVAASAQETLKVEKASARYDAVVEVKGCGGTEQDNLPDVCSGPGRVSLYRKGEKAPFQVLRLRNIWLDKSSVGHSPETSDKPRGLYEEEYGLVFEDFNFDGHEDLAVCNGREGGYSGPSYNVYLFNSQSKKFVLSSALTALAEAPSLGLFFPDAKKKQLVAYSKSGCCYHETNRYALVNNRPVLVEKIIEDATLESGAPEGYMLVTTRKKVGARWIVRKRREKIEQENERN